MGRLDNKVAIVTASTRGTGRAMVKAFAEEGAIVYMAVRKVEMGKQIAGEFNASGGNVKVVFFDAGDTASYESMIDEVKRAEGRIDILVNNFGGTDPRNDKNIMECKYEDFIHGVELNLKSVFLASQLVINKAMKEQKSGSIINISSIAGLVPDVTQCAYGTAKAGINHLTKMIAGQVGKYNIRCNAVCPGMTATEAVETHLPEEYRQVFVKHTPIHRIATPEEIAAAAVYFASCESAYTTGQILAVNGGYGQVAPTYGDQFGK